MPYFPQLSTGALAQLPLDRSVIRRTAVNELADGSVVKVDDPDSGAVYWKLAYKGLTDAERIAIEELFVAVEGQLGTFLFVDPAGNMLRWSEDLSQTVWQKDGQLQVASGISDPLAGDSATRLTNAGQVYQGLEQTADAPSSYQYCFSVVAQAAAPCSIRISLADESSTVTTEHQIGSRWATYACSALIEGVGDIVTARLEVAAGAAVDVYGLQLDAQPSPSRYRRTQATGGVYKNTRFIHDTLKFVANGIDDHSTTIRLYSHTGAQG